MSRYCVRTARKQQGGCAPGLGLPCPLSLRNATRKGAAPAKIPGNPNPVFSSDPTSDTARAHVSTTRQAAIVQPHAEKFNPPLAALTAPSLMVSFLIGANRAHGVSQTPPRMTRRRVQRRVGTGTGADLQREASPQPASARTLLLGDPWCVCVTVPPYEGRGA